MIEWKKAIFKWPNVDCNVIVHTTMHGVSVAMFNKDGCFFTINRACHNYRFYKSDGFKCEIGASVLTDWDHINYPK